MCSLKSRHMGHTVPEIGWRKWRIHPTPEICKANKPFQLILTVQFFNFYT
ncbi:hypothetical protein HanIR_Chr17g0882501 [Helianthus annuus]|nr:hypothetical protein HanIR_Chr17g0882501 [Helianthus annuus]